MRLLNYLKMMYLKSLFFLNAKEKNRTCIFVKRPIERYQTFKWTQWIDVLFEYKNIRENNY